MQNSNKSTNQNQEICPYYSPEYNAIPQYLEMEAGESLELRSKTTNHLIFILTGEIIIDFEGEVGVQ